MDARGVAVSDNWEVNTHALRTWLRTLRGICTHPQVGQLLGQADKTHKPGVLKTMSEVLEVGTILRHKVFSSLNLLLGNEGPELEESYGRSQSEGP